jgi:hypothetical protein
MTHYELSLDRGVLGFVYMVSFPHPSRNTNRKQLGRAHTRTRLWLTPHGLDYTPSSAHGPSTAQRRGHSVSLSVCQAVIIQWRWCVNKNSRLIIILDGMCWYKFTHFCLSLGSRDEHLIFNLQLQQSKASAFYKWSSHSPTRLINLPHGYIRALL